MPIERLLQINMATLAALGALLLGMGQRSEAPPLLVALAAAASVWLTDLSGCLRLGRRLANLLMLLAAAVSIGQVLPLRSELQAFDFAWFVIYLQIILLFQQKDERVYWLLIVLSLLEVVVATLFSQGAGFGVLLAVYLLLGFSAMTLLLLYRQWERYRPQRPAADHSPLRCRHSVPTLPSRARRGSARRWPLAGPQPDFVATPGGNGQAAICRGLFGRLGRMGLHSLALALVLFFTLPRFGQLAWRGPAAKPRALVGFSDKVALGSLGQIIESPDEVMRVRFYQYPANTPLRRPWRDLPAGRLLDELPARRVGGGRDCPGGGQFDVAARRPAIAAFRCCAAKDHDRGVGSQRVVFRRPLHPAGNQPFHQHRLCPAAVAPRRLFVHAAA